MLTVTWTVTLTVTSTVASALLCYVHFGKAISRCHFEETDPESDALVLMKVHTGRV